jgi:glycosyltransferase involved in cell wall biosynthesis
MSNPTHILIICSGLDTPGGIERAITNTANLFSEKGNRVTILVLDESKQSFYPINTEIEIKQFHLHFGIAKTGNILSRKINFFNHIKNLKKIIISLAPGVIITTEYVHTIAARIAIKKSIKIISWEHHHFNWLSRNTFWKLLYKYFYPKIDLVVCLNETEEKYYRQIGCKTFVIPNFIPILPQKTSLLESKIILTIGWLIKRKGVDLIPAIAEIVFKQHPNWKWKIIGIGEEEASLVQKIEDLNIARNFEIIEPNTPDVEKEYLSCSVYAMPSRFECFPMVLLESLSYGVPAVAFDCPTGPGDIIKNGEDGFLVEKENINAMAGALLFFIQNEEKRKQFGKNGRQNIQRYSADAIYELWKPAINVK